MSQITDTSDVLLGVPGGAVSSASLGGELRLRITDTIGIAFVGADGTLASDAFVVGEALALASLCITQALIGALDVGVGVIGVLYAANPSLRFGARPQGAIGARPSGITVRPQIATALVVLVTGALSAAPIGAVAQSERKQAQKRDQES